MLNVRTELGLDAESDEADDQKKSGVCVFGLGCPLSRSSRLLWTATVHPRPMGEVGRGILEGVFVIRVVIVVARSVYRIVQSTRHVGMAGAIQFVILAFAQQR
jgi:hypothetical protein